MTGRKAGHLRPPGPVPKSKERGKDGMNAKLQTQRPKPEEFIDFRLCGKGAHEHRVYQWLRDQSAFQRAQGKFCRLKTGKADSAGIEQGSQADEALLDFSQRIAYCLGHYFDESASKVWKGPARDRQRAAREYAAAVRWLKKGFGPYDRESKEQLGELLRSSRKYLLGKHVSAGFRLKGGTYHPVGMLIRELTAYLEYFELPQASLTSVIIDLVDLVGEIVDAKTVQRHVKAVRSSS